MMHDATMQGSPRKKFNKIRGSTDGGNYATTKVRNALPGGGGAKRSWDRSTPSAGRFVVCENRPVDAQ